MQFVINGKPDRGGVRPSYLGFGFAAGSSWPAWLKEGLQPRSLWRLHGTGRWCSTSWRRNPLIQHKHGLIGAPVSRLDGPLKVSGAAPFAAEFPVDGMVYAALAYSTVARGRIAMLDTSAAEAAPGVVLVMTYKNAPRLKPTPVFNTAPKAAGPSDLPIMQDDCIHWNGEAVAVVLAETQEGADYAKSLIRVSYEVEDAAVSFAEAMTHAHDPESVLGEPPEVKSGDAEAALVDAPHRVDLTYRTPRYNHNAIELHAVTLFWQDDKLFLHDASQAVAQTAWTLGKVFGLKEEQVHVSSPYVGGGFGGKTLWFHHVLAAAASKLAARPVRLVLSREGVYRIVGGRTTTEQRVAIGADAEGRFEALIHTGTAAMTAHNNCPEQFTFPAVANAVYNACGKRVRELPITLEKLLLQ